jgi:hypothetical protein
MRASSRGWISNWPPPLDVLRDARAQAAKEWALQALDRVTALTGRGVVRAAAEVIGVLAAADHIDEGVWRARLVESAGKAGHHRDVQRQATAGLAAGRRRNAGAPPPSKRPDPERPAAPPPDARTLMARWQAGTLSEGDVWALVDDACRAVRTTRDEPDGLRYLRRRHTATSAAARLVGILQACGIVDRWAVDVVVEAARVAGYLSPEKVVDDMIADGYAAAWEFIRDDAIWQHLVRHGLAQPS